MCDTYAASTREEIPGPSDYRNVGSKSVTTLTPGIFQSVTKTSNPKDAIASNKIPMHLWPETATVMGSMGLLDGALKYGRSNWRGTGVKASVYYDAIRRHLAAWFEGEDFDPDSGLSHLCHILANAAILADARAAGKLTDDRQYPGGYKNEYEVAGYCTKDLNEKHKDKTPKHYTYSTRREPTR